MSPMPEGAHEYPHQIPVANEQLGGSSSSFSPPTSPKTSRSNVGLQGRYSVGTQAKAQLVAMHALSEWDKNHEFETAGAELKAFFDKQGGGSLSCLKAWFKHFDKEQLGTITYKEFDHGLTALNYPAGRDHQLKVWQLMDDDHSGAISFDEFAVHRDSELWSKFRRWCGSRFQGPKDMIHQLKVHYGSVNGLEVNTDDVIHEREFVQSLPTFGWEGGSEDMFFHAFDVDDQGCIWFRHLKWIEVEVRRFKNKENAKRRAQKLASLKSRSNQESQAALNDFKAFLKRHYGPLFRAWRKCLDHDGSMTLQRAELFKACKAINWKGDARALWKALDHDNSGATTIEELDPHCAQLLANFKAWADDTCNPKTHSDIWDMLDPNNRKKLSYSYFIKQCEARGFHKKVKMLPVMLDWQDKKYIQEKDLDFFDVWRVPPWLNATPNPQAANAFRKHLVAKYGHSLKAWRVAMDKDCSNSCNWHEFQEASKTIRFHGDLAGAWLSLDVDLSGSISLEEIDPSAHASLFLFKTWCDQEFGGLRHAFRVLDADASGFLTLKEFKCACKNYGFPGDCNHLFFCLDQGNERTLQTHEVFFLDNWRTEEDPPANEKEDSIRGRNLQGCGRPGDRMLEYSTPNPGPGAYNVPSSFGAKPSCPVPGRHGGTFSMGARCGDSCVKPQKGLGPAKYVPSVENMILRKPSWSFADPGSRPMSARDAPRSAMSVGARQATGRPTTPGPGAYFTSEREGNSGPKFSM
ncbi:unnamed protein product, partial [Polarella glacialis]